MAFREVGMFEIKEVLRLWHASVPKKAIARTVGVDPKTVRRYVQAAEELGLAAPLVSTSLVVVSVSQVQLRRRVAAQLRIAAESRSSPTIGPATSGTWVAPSDAGRASTASSAGQISTQSTIRSRSRDRGLPLGFDVRGTSEAATVISYTCALAIFFHSLWRGWRHAMKRSGTPEWTDVATAASRLDIPAVRLRRLAKRHAKTMPDGAVEARFDGIRARKLGRRWLISLGSGWTDR